MAVAVGDQRRKKEALELLVSELGKGDEESIISSLRTALERGLLTSFYDCLEDSRRKKDAEIDRICARHYTDFLTSVGEMLKMKGSASDLLKLVKTVHNKFSRTNGDLLKILNDLQRIQREKENTEKLLKISLVCKDVTLLMLEVKREIENDNHYHAMRIIESIQRDLSTNPALFPLKKTLDTWLPIAINKLLYAARTDADNFLSDLRSAKMKLIGNTVLLKQAKLIVQSEKTSHELAAVLLNVPIESLAFDSLSTSESRKTTSAGEIGHKRFISNDLTNFNPFVLPDKYSITTKYLLKHVTNLYKQTQLAQAPYIFPLTIDTEECVPFHFEPNLVVSADGVNLIENSLISDMSVIHKVLHLYAILGNLQNYYDYYAHNRYEVFKMKLSKNLEKNISSNGFLTSIYLYFEEMVGFFMIEIMIYRLIENNSIYFQVGELEKLWEETISEFQNKCLHFAVTMNHPQELIQVKEEVILILFIILDHGIFYPNWNIGMLLNVIISLWDVFDGLQIQLLQRNIFLHLSKACFQPYQVSDYNSFYLHVKFFHLDMIEIYEENIISSKFGNISSLMESNNLPGLRGPPSLGTSKRDVMTLNRLEANLDALEQELSFGGGNSSLAGNESKSNIPSTGAETSKTPSIRQPSSSFLPQTYPFSEFVPLIFQELHGMLIRLLLFGTIPTPDRQNKNFMSEIYKLQSIQAVRFDSLSMDDFGSFAGLSTGTNNPEYSKSNRKVNHLNHNSIKQSIHSSSSLYHCIQECKFEERICLSFKSYFEVMLSVLTKELSRDGMETVLSKAVQIYLDCATLAASTEYFFHTFVVESLVAIYGKDRLDFSWMDVVLADIIAMIKKTMNLAQDMIFELLSNKIDVLLESSLMFLDLEPETFYINPMYASTASNANGVNNFVSNLNYDGFNAFLVHESIESIIEYLKITFMCLTHLPKLIRETVYYVSCYKLSNGVIDFLLSPKIARINVFGILSLDADCKKLVQFAESCGIIHLRECFDELSQMVNALLSPELPVFGDNQIVRNSLYPRLNVLKFANLLDKVSPSPIVAQSLNLPKYDKTLTKTVAKKLRSQPSISRDLKAEILL